MHVTFENRQARDGWWEATASLRYGKRFSEFPREVYVRSSVGPLSNTADFLVPLTLLPAMVRGEDLYVEGEISPRLLGSLAQLQFIFKVFGPSFGHDTREIAVHAPARQDEPLPAGRGAACFFSGGADSLYSALKHRDELDALIFVHGLDTQLADAGLRSTVIAGVRRAAEAIGLPLIEVETNAKEFANRFVHWELYYGSPLAAMALLFQPLFSKVYIAGGRALPRLYSSGSHPMLDPLWSTEGCEVIYDGADAERWQKLQYLATSEIAQKHLRVCYENRNGAYNCGECSKCVLTMISLRIFGTLDRFDVFDKPLDLEMVSRMDATDGGMRIRVEDSIAILEQRQTDPELLEALHDCMRHWSQNYTTGASQNSIASWLATAWPRTA